MLYITGDTHIPIDISKLNARRFPQQRSLTKSDHLIICGDFGGVWDDSREEHYWRKWLDHKNFTTLFIDGNHENFDLLRNFEVIDFCGGKAHKISDSIYHLMRGQVYELDGKKIFTFGGASSHDKAHRQEGKSWWKEELPTHEEMQAALHKLDAIGWNADYVITHCAPTSMQRSVASSYASDELTDFLEEISRKLSFQKWYFGHYHIDQTIEEKYQALFDGVQQIL